MYIFKGWSDTKYVRKEECETIEPVPELVGVKDKFGNPCASKDISIDIMIVQYRYY